MGWRKLHARAKGGKGTLWRGYIAAPPPFPVCTQPFTPCSEHVVNTTQADKGGGYVGKQGAHMQEGGVRKAVPCRRKGECTSEHCLWRALPRVWVQRPGAWKGEPPVHMAKGAPCYESTRGLLLHGYDSH